jgi:hypothetical protein
MTTQITATRFKDQAAVTVESEKIAATFLPSIGANMCSLVYKPAAKELLVRRPADRYKVAAYDGDYVADGECAGFDDMFPSIDKCFYESYPWRGTPIPDHGEVWSLPWEANIHADGIHLATHGVRFPYQLEKQVSFRDEHTLHIAYRLTNLSSFPLDFLWAAHPMFVLEEGACLRLPPGVRKVVTTLSFSGSLGRYGDEFDWPLAVQPDGVCRDLSQIRPKSVRDAAKYYVKGRLPEGWCALTYPQTGLVLQLSFPADSVPYLGILPNEAGWQDLYNIFLEPATASFDRLDVARLRGECSIVGAHAQYAWYLDIAINEATI